MAAVAVIVLAVVSGIVLLAQGGDDDGDESSGGSRQGQSTGGETEAQGPDADLPGEDQDYVDALIVAAEASTSNEDDPFYASLGDEGLRCWATAIVDVVGTDALREVATPEQIRETTVDYLSDIELDVDEAGAFYDQTTGCIDWREVFLMAFGQYGLTSEQIDCVDESVGDDLIRDFWVTSFGGDPDAANDEVRAATQRCGLGGG